MNILIVTYFYSPIIDAHSYRWSQIAQLWAKQGHAVEVVTRAAPHAPARATEGGVDVARSGFRARAPATAGPAGTVVGIGARVKGLLRGLTMSVYRKLYWPDSAWHWLPALTAQMFQRRKRKYDLVISYYPCFSAHIGVFLLKKMSVEPGFVWLADYGDPFCASSTMQPNNYQLYAGLNESAERALSRTANQLVLTNEETADEYRKRLFLTDQICVIPHLVDIEQNYGVVARQRDAGATLIMRYIGGFHRAVRSPQRMLELLRALREEGGIDFKVEIYGPLNGFSPTELAPVDMPYVGYFGVVTRARALELMRGADFLLNVDNENCVMTPSKVVECISVGAKLINISNPQVDYLPLNAYVARGHAISITEQTIDSAVLRTVGQFISNNAQHHYAPLAEVQGILAEHALPSVAERYLALARAAVPTK